MHALTGDVMAGILACRAYSTKQDCSFKAARCGGNSIDDNCRAGFDGRSGLRAASAPQIGELAASPTRPPAGGCCSMTQPGDLLEGAQAIADYLATLGGSWTARRVYYLVERGSDWPIWSEPGIGLLARKSGLQAYLERREREALAGRRP